MTNVNIFHSRNWHVSPPLLYVFLSTDHQKLEREARICRLLKHPNIGESCFNTTLVSHSLPIRDLWLLIRLGKSQFWAWTAEKTTSNKPMTSALRTNPDTIPYEGPTICIGSVFSFPNRSHSHLLYLDVTRRIGRWRPIHINTTSLPF